MPGIIIRKSHIFSAVNIILLVCSLAAVSANELYIRCFSDLEEYPVYSVETDEKKICITFDAAWECSDTDEIIEILKKHNAYATIFAVAQWAEKNQDSVIKFQNAGHEIENHSYNHKLYTELSDSQIFDDIAGSTEILAGICGKNPAFIRVPSGEYSKRVINNIYSIGIIPVQWDVDSLDYTGINVEAIVKRVVPKVRNGSIVLFHNGVKNTPKALDIILTELESQGYEFVKVSELVYTDDFSFNFEGRQFRNQTS